MSSHPFDYLPLPSGKRFIFTPCPGTKDADLADSLAQLKEAGATAIVTLLPDEEMTSLGVPELASRVEEQGLQWFQIPAEDDGMPDETFLSALHASKQALLEHMQEGGVIAIHCRGGSGRTGLMAAILLLESGESWETVYSLIQSIRPKALTLANHLDFLAAHYETS